MQLLAVNDDSDFGRKLQELLSMQFIGEGGIEVTRSGAVVSIIYRPRDSGGSGGRASKLARMVITGTSDDTFGFKAKFVDSQGVPLKDKDGKDLPATTLYVQCFPPTAVSQILPDIQVGDVVIVATVTVYNESTDEDEDRPYLLTPFIPSCSGGN